MTLIKMYFVGSLRALSTDISKRMSDNVCTSLRPSHPRLINPLFAGHIIYRTDALIVHALPERLDATRAFTW